MQDRISHIVWGEGAVISRDGKYIHVLFDDAEVGSKTFIYPDAFDHHMKYADADLQSEAEKLLRERRENDESLKRAELQKKQQAALAARVKLLELKAKQRRARAVTRKKREDTKKPE